MANFAIHHFLLRFVLAGPGIVDEAGGRAWEASGQLG